MAETYELVDSHKRSWGKSIVWGIIGIFILGYITWLFTHSWEKTTWITLTFHTIRLVLYYVHERIWMKIQWGKKRVAQEDYSI